MTASRHAEFEAWLQADRRHRGALVRAQAALHLLEEAVAQGAPALDRSGNDNVYGRRPVHKAGPWAFAASVAGLLALGAAWLAWPEHPSSVAMHRMELADGSVATLHGDARITSEITDGVRNITLLNGEASFTVARDRSRPFVVRAGEVRAQATGTVYSVSRVGQTGASVDVREGSVLVWAREGRDQAVLLRAGGRLTLEPPASEGSLPASPDVAQIALDNDTLDSAVVRFNRINQTQIIVADDGIGGMRITGLFNANDPQAFARAAAVVSGGHVLQRGENIVIDAK